MISDTILTTQIHHAEGFARFTANQIERGLLLLAALFVGVTQFGFLLASRQSLLDGYPLAVWLLCAFGAHLVLCRALPHRDPLIFPIVMLFCGWGLVLIERLAPPFAAKQTLWLVVSALVLWGIVSLPLHLRWLQRYRYVWLFGGLALLGATIVVGATRQASVRACGLACSTPIFNLPNYSRCCCSSSSRATLPNNATC